MSDFDRLRITHYVEHTKVLGPYDRSALWVHGCCFDCKGCLAKEMNAGASVEYTPKELASILTEIKGTEGITISGGEPFLQPQSLSNMIAEIRNERDYGLIVYSGFTYEKLIESKEPGVQEFLNQIDILIDGQYMQELDDGKPYRGSSNQRILLLSDRYKNEIEAYYIDSDKRNIEINVTKDKIYLVGVPSENGLNTWRKFRAKAVISNE